MFQIVNVHFAVILIYLISGWYGCSLQYTLHNGVTWRTFTCHLPEHIYNSNWLWIHCQYLQTDHKQNWKPVVEYKWSLLRPMLLEIRQPPDGYLWYYIKTIWCIIVINSLKLIRLIGSWWIFAITLHK